MSVDHFALSRVRVQLRRILATSMSQAVRDQVENFVTKVTDENSTVPSVVPSEDGGAILHWVAGNASIEVEVGATGARYLWATRVDGGQETLADDPSAIQAATRRLVADMAAHVNAVNPRWRDVFLSAPTCDHQRIQFRGISVLDALGLPEPPVPPHTVTT